MSSSFFAMLSRMKYIDRWALMRNTHNENLSEHCLEVAAIAHALAAIANRRYGGSYNAERAALLGIYHDMPEIITGDMPTPVKYGNDDIKAAYKRVEADARTTLVAMLPEDLQADFDCLFNVRENDKPLLKLVKAADKISALTKCIEEAKAGNREFASAESSLRRIISEMQLPEADCFVKEFVGAYSLTLDELLKSDK